MFHVKHSPLPYRRHIIFCDKMEKEKIESVKGKVRNVPDFPVKGIQFKDLTTAFKDPESLRVMADALIDLYKDKGITKVVGIEARGFIFGAILARPTLRSMARTLSRSTRTLLARTTWCSCTTTCSPQVAQWLPPSTW